MTQLAVYMDQEGPENPLQGEEAYFSSLHLQCTGYKTPTLFVYHPAIWHILRLANMKLKVNLDMKSVCSGSCLIGFLAQLQRQITNSTQKQKW